MKKKKNEEYKKSQITTINIFGFTYKTFILLGNIVWNKVPWHFIEFLCVAGYLNSNNDTPKLNVHKYTNYGIIKIYINRLSTTMQKFVLHRRKN